MQPKPERADNLAAAMGVQTGMSPSSPQAPLQNTGLTFWIIAVVIAVVVVWAVWHFGKRSEHGIRNNPGVYTSSELILDKA